MARIRGVAQPGRVLGLGPRCRRFEPSHPDQKIQIGLVPILILCLWVQMVDALQQSCPGSTMSKRERVCEVRVLTNAPQPTLMCRARDPSHPDQKIQIGVVPILILCLWVQTKIFLIVFWNQIPKSRHPGLDPGSNAPQAE